MFIENEYLETALGALKASISVLLILSYGFGLRRFKLFTNEGEKNMDYLSARLFLSALLFSEIGPQASLDNLKNYWSIIVLSIFFQALSIVVGLFGHRFLRLPQWIVPALVFNNTTSLPLLLIQSLQKTGALEALLEGPDDTVTAAASRATSYILLNSLVCNIARFALGPTLMSSKKADDVNEENTGLSEERDPLLEYDYNTHVDGHAYDDEEPSTPRSRTERIKKTFKSVLHRVQHTLQPLKPVYTFLRKYINPPLIAGALAIFCGIIPALHTGFFDNDSSLQQTFTTSIKNVGALYTVTQILVLGSKLQSKKGSSIHLWPLFVVFLWRFALVPALSLSTVYFVRKWKPDIVRRDPILDFILIMAPVGPPAITLAAIAEMANLQPGEDGKIARLLTISYIITPIISLPMSAAVKVATVDSS